MVDWMPIGSAPINGDVVMVSYYRTARFEESREEIVFAWFDDIKQRWFCETERYPIYPTHWTYHPKTPVYGHGWNSIDNVPKDDKTVYLLFHPGYSYLAYWEQEPWCEGLPGWINAHNGEIITDVPTHWTPSSFQVS